MNNKYEAYRCMECGIMNVLHNGEGTRCRKCGGTLLPMGNVIMDKEQKESSNSIVIDVSINKKHLQRVQTMCNKIANAIGEYIRADEEPITTETLTNDNGDVVNEFINNRFNNVI